MKATIVDTLRDICGAQYVLDKSADRICYASDGTWQSASPDVVVLPASAAEIAAIMRLANEQQIPSHPPGRRHGAGWRGSARQGRDCPIIDTHEPDS